MGNKLTLHTAIEQQKWDKVTEFLEGGTDVNTFDQDHRTALHLVVIMQ